MQSLAQDWQEVETSLEETAEVWALSSKNLGDRTSTTLKVIIALDGSLKFCDSSGQTLREELPPQRLGEVSCQGNYLECAQFGQAYFKGEFAHAG